MDCPVAEMVIQKTIAAGCWLRREIKLRGTHECLVEALKATEEATQTLRKELLHEGETYVFDPQRNEPSGQCP